MAPWHTQQKLRSRKERLEEALALSKFWSKAGKESSAKSTATHYKTLLREIEEEDGDG